MRRFAHLVLVLFLVFAICRWLIRLLPGDPIETLMLESGTAIPIEQVRSELGLDRPYWVSLWTDLARWLQGDFGTSLRSRQPIAPVLWSALKNSALLATLAFGVSLLWSLSIGTIAALGDKKLATVQWVSKAVSTHGAMAASVPSAWLGPVAIYVLCVHLKWFDISGSLALAVLILSFYLAGFWARVVRLRVSESLSLLYCRTLESQGASFPRLAWKGGLRPVLPSLTTYFGTQFGGLLGGSFLIETLLEWPGLGELLVESILKRDYTIVQVAVFWSAGLALLGTAAGDLSQKWLDPRAKQ
jgi:ABC-type dipeptide/oligopeptide/nickel transport system permease component